MLRLFLTAVTCTAIVQMTSALRQHPALLFAVAGDDDMKIASPGGFSKRQMAEDASEEETQEFLRMKRLGNIDKARNLGKSYARTLLKKQEEMSKNCEAEEDDPLCTHQLLVLCSYAVNRAISELSPNSILAQTALNVFYGELEIQNDELYRHISDMAAFSLYILCERSDARSEDEIGRIFAQLCGEEGDPAATEKGNACYRSFYAECAAELERMEYKMDD